MNAIKKTIYGVGLMLCGVSLTSCDSFLEEYSQDLAKVTGWEDLDEVLLGDAYIKTCRIVSANYSVGTENRDSDFDFLHYMTDEITMTEYTGNDLLYYDYTVFPFYTWQQDTGTDYNLRYSGGDAQYWNTLYSRINVCNMVISLIDEQPAPTEIDEQAKRRVKGEAYFLRGLYYFMLANLYCEPYAPSTASSTVGLPMKYSEVVEDKEYTRENLEVTYENIISDLRNAEEYLEGTTPKSLYRAGLPTAKLLLSRVYLYMQDWSNAVKKAREVLDINSRLLSLSSKTPGDACLDASSPEVLFSMGDYMVASLFSDERRNMAKWRVSDEMVALYSSDDLRKNRYIGNSQFNRPNAFRKFNGQSEAWGPINTVGSVFTFRTSEAYLTLAEASAYSGDETTARTTLEKFLATRMSGKVSVDESGNDLIDFIRDERAREFLIEGHRWFDLRRYTVCQPYPWSKVIEHGYYYITRKDYDDVIDRIDWYRLEKNDGAYTLPLPRDIRNFQVSLGNASRPSRSPYLSTKPEGDGGDDWDDDDDWWDDDWNDDDDW